MTDQTPAPTGPPAARLLLDVSGAPQVLLWTPSTGEWGSVWIAPEQAAHVLFHYHAGGMEAGSFTMSLIELIARADPTNRARLALGFPGYTAAVTLAADTTTGIAQLQRIAERLTATPAAEA